MNRQHTKFRNSLLPEKVTKLTSIAMNEPTFQGSEETKPLQQDNEAMEEELVAIELTENERSGLAEQLLNVDEFSVEENEAVRLSQGCGVRTANVGRIQ